MSKSLEENIRIEIDKAAVLSSLVYKDVDSWEITSLDKQIDGLSDEMGNLEVIATSKTLGFDDKKLVAFALKDKQTGDVFVVYRGTGDGKWLDNGIGMFDENTPIQEEALNFYNKIVENEVANNPNFSGRLIVTGHSKGGNLAQYVTMASDYGNLVDNCYSIDGQGFSKKAIENFQTKTDYAARIEKLYSINGQNDYVDPLGIVIIPESRTFFVKNVDLDPNDNTNIFVHWHEISGIMNGTGLNWDYSVVDGQKVYNYNLEAGPINRLLKELSANMMELNDEQLEDCAISIMYLLESTIGNVGEIADGYRNSITFEEFLGFMDAGLPLVLNTLANSEETPYLLKSFGIEEWYAMPLIDALSDVADTISTDEFAALCNSVKDWGNSKGVDSWKGILDYIIEDPIRLVDLYASLDLNKETVNKAISAFLSTENIANLVGSFIAEHPVITAVGAAALSIPAVREAVAILTGIVAAIGVCALIVNHIIVNWDNICKAYEYVEDKICEFFNEAKNAAHAQVTRWVSSVFDLAEKCITTGSRVVNSLIDGATDFWNFLKEQTVSSLKQMLFISNPLIYLIASKVYNAKKEPLKINVSKISNCVDTMNRLARRVATIDQRLDNLYWRLAENNIEESEGLFTSLANIFNLFRADLNVDEGAAIKRKAKALTELYSDYESTEKWVMDNIPQEA